MPSRQQPDLPGDPQYDETYWRDFLTHGSPLERVGRRLFKIIPSDPRCQMCAAPFQGAGAPVMRIIGKRRSDANPKMCTSCETFLIAHHGGAEVEGSMLFADIRGSTTLAESMSPTEFRALLDRFYAAATQVVFAHNGAVDKFVGDELVAFFTPLMTGAQHARPAIEAATDLLRATGHGEPGGPWVPVGAGVNSGTVWFGAIGEGSHVELTAVGDEVNVAARLASAAAAGEVLVTAAAARAAGLPTHGAERRHLELKGKLEPTDVVVLTVGGARRS